MNTRIHFPKPNRAAGLAGALFAAALFAATVSSQAAAPTYNWNGSTSSEYGVGANWTAVSPGVQGNVPGQAPPATPTDVAAINLNGAAVLYDQGSYNYGLANLNIATAGTPTAGLTLSAGVLGATNSGGNFVLIGNANGAIGTLTIGSGGTFNLQRNDGAGFFKDSLMPGNGAGSTGTFAVSGGTATILGGIEMGSAGTGIVDVSSGVLIDNGWFGVGRGGGSGANGNGIFNLSGGTVYLLRNPGTEGGTSGMAFCQGGTNGTVNISGGVLYVNTIRFATTAGPTHNDTETLNVSGGDIYLGSGGVVYGNGGGTKTITVNLSGGTFHTANMGPNTGGTQGTNSITFTGPQAGANWVWSALVPAILTNNPGPGVVTFAPDPGRTITLSNDLSGVGGMTMIGPGTLDIENIDTYTGATTINGGTLMGYGQIQGSVTANSGSTIAPGGALTPGTLTLSSLGQNLTLNGNTLIFRLSGDPTQVGNGVNDLLVAGGQLTLQGLSTIRILPLAPLSTASPYTLFQYTGTPLTTADLARLQFASSRYNFSFVDPITTLGSIQIRVTGGNSANLVWKGGNATSPNNWDHTTANWLNTGTSASDFFFDGDVVVFDNTAAVSAVTVVGSQQPASMRMSNTTVGFTFGGDGPLGGVLDTEGANGLTALAMTNPPTFSYITNNQGTLLFNLANSGLNTLDSTISDDGGGHGTIIQAGTNTLVLNGDASAYKGTFVVTNGILRYTSATALGDAGSPLYVTNGGTLDFNRVDASTKPIVASGTGYNNQGALTDSSGNAGVNNDIGSLTLAGDTLISAVGRWDSDSGFTLVGNGHKLTSKGGTILLGSPTTTGDSGLGDIEVTAGRLGFQNGITLGDPTKTATVDPGAVLTLYSLSTVVDKHIALNTATLDSGGAANTVVGPVNLVVGTNTLALRTDLTLNGIVSGPGAISVQTNFPGAGGFGGTLHLAGANTYSGPTLLTQGATVVLADGSSLGSSSLIVLNSASTLDVTALSTPLTLGSGQTLAGVGMVAGNLTFGSGSTLAVGVSSNVCDNLTLNGAVVFQAGSTNLFKLNPGASPANDSVIGLTSVTFGGRLVVTNIGTGSLAVSNSFQLFNAGTYNPGAFAAYELPALAPDLGWDTTRLGVDGTIKVIAKPQLTGANRRSDGNIEVTFTSDPSSTSYTLWASTNVALPLAQWSAIAIGPISGSPTTVPDLTSTNYPQRFYLISVP